VKRPVVIKILSGLVNILTYLVAVTIVLYWQDWFGKGDIYSFLFWTVPFAAALTVAGKRIINLFRASPFFLRLLFIILTSALLSFSWTYCVALLLGPWMGAFSIPVLYLWFSSSVLQLLFLDWRLPKPIVKQKVS
jgi:hypothetical protein